MLLYGKILREVKGLRVWQDQISIMSAQSVICYLATWGDFTSGQSSHINPHLITMFLDPIGKILRNLYLDLIMGTFYGTCNASPVVKWIV